MFEDDEDDVVLPAGHMRDAEEIESTLAPPMSMRSRSVTTQHKLDQLERQRELAAQKRQARKENDMIISKDKGVKSSGLRMLSTDSEDDDEEEDDRYSKQKIMSLNDRGSTIKAISSKKDPHLSNAEKKLQMLGLSSEVDHTDDEPKAGSKAKSDSFPSKRNNFFAEEPDGEKEKEDADDDGESDIAGQISVLDVNSVKAFVFRAIPRSQSQPIQCYIKRLRAGFQKLWPSYVLYSQDPDKFLLSGRRRKKNKQSTYLISTDEKDLARKSDNYTGKVKSNFVGTEFTIYDNGKNPTRKKEDAEVRVELGVIQYDRNVLGSNGPRKMQVWLPKTSKAGDREKIQPTSVEEKMSAKITKEHNYIRLVNKTPRWNENLGAFCLNFQGRVTVASVKNFQLVDENNPDRVVLQFGKCSEDIFTMDYSYPLCALQVCQLVFPLFLSPLLCSFVCHTTQLLCHFVPCAHLFLRRLPSACQASITSLRASSAYT
mmetsp:Transcript_8963/g.20525  ORF Transcript_8963/g.20525 Transcript_8963/m.20525 type:complete len:486 (+) Transcript_8963:90-1547(+)